MGASRQCALGPDPAEDGGRLRANDGFGRRQTKVEAVEGLKYSLKLDRGFRVNHRHSRGRLQV